MFCRSFILVSLLGAVVALTNCATGQRFQVHQIQQEGNGSVYLYRKFVWDGMGTSPTITLDGEPQGYLKNAGYMHFELPPGRHVLDTQGNTKWEKHARPHRFSLRAGETRYVKLDTERMVYSALDIESETRTGRNDPQFVLVNEATAEREIKELKLSK